MDLRNVTLCEVYDLRNIRHSQGNLTFGALVRAPNRHYGGVLGFRQSWETRPNHVGYVVRRQMRVVALGQARIGMLQLPAITAIGTACMGRIEAWIWCGT